MQGGADGQNGGGGGMAMLMRAMEREECEAGTSLMEQVSHQIVNPFKFPSLFLPFEQENDLLPSRLELAFVYLMLAVCSWWKLTILSPLTCRTLISAVGGWVVSRGMRNSS